MHVNYIYSNALTMAADGDCVLDGLKAKNAQPLLFGFKCLY